jgi:hypothetical protein
MTRKMFDKLIECFYPGCIVTEYVELDRNTLNENNEWVKDSPALFVTITTASGNKILWESTEKESQKLSDFTGYEIVINKENYLI